uniref:Uncharacterized protein n=1 Tax=Chromera velia CCMP2878 TaxID=1169474 RepID=A0A0G4FVF5_9ALVE|eukprot:Cvel_18988.t1-p1 / transcript=Cvel_18988.t1 / gene=Cvel_18988 / organism=Chromera_velia_CCMP2878 / gene_product=hypothetical protein / transcript_product=hypothetical protein / location=Cvel_scaffold1606:41118-41585(+) / protein_length=156 / sequence_SO=supercontig / SO=protein_coding / is_pseudo=false
MDKREVKPLWKGYPHSPASSPDSLPDHPSTELPSIKVKEEEVEAASVTVNADLGDEDHEGMFSSPDNEEEQPKGDQPLKVEPYHPYNTRLVSGVIPRVLISTMLLAMLKDYEEDQAKKAKKAKKTADPTEEEAEERCQEHMDDEDFGYDGDNDDSD